MRRWWMLPLAIFAVSRVVESLLLQHLLGMQHDLMIPPGGGMDHLGHQVSLIEGLSNWDGAWYHQIAVHGYPHHLPRVDGVVRQNAWAFYPMFPALVRVVMVLGLPFDLSAVIVSTTCAAIACCLLFKIVSRRASEFTATMAVVGLMFAPMAPIFEAAYTESLALLLLLLAVMALGARRYGWFVVFSLLLGVARPIALPLALLCAVHGLARWRRRSEEPFERSEQAKVVIATGFAALSFGLWPAVAALRTGFVDAYFQTQHAWADADGHGRSSWLQQALQLNSLMTVSVVAAVLIIAVVLVVKRDAKLWGPELRTWTWAYPLYILATARPTPSIFRYLLLTVTPWWPMPAVSERIRSTPARIGLIAVVVAVGLILQWLWLSAYFVIWPHRLGAA